MRRIFLLYDLNLNGLSWLGRRGSSAWRAWLGIRLADVDAALEEGTIFDTDAGCCHIAGERAFAALRMTAKNLPATARARANATTKAKAPAVAGALWFA